MLPFERLLAELRKIATTAAKKTTARASALRPCSTEPRRSGFTASQPGRGCEKGPAAPARTAGAFRGYALRRGAGLHRTAAHLRCRGERQSRLRIPHSDRGPDQRGLGGPLNRNRYRQQGLDHPGRVRPRPAASNGSRCRPAPWKSLRGQRRSAAVLSSSSRAVLTVSQCPIWCF